MYCKPPYCPLCFYSTVVMDTQKGWATCPVCLGRSRIEIAIEGVEVEDNGWIDVYKDLQ